MKDKLLYKEAFRLSSEFVKTFLRESEEYYTYIKIPLRSFRHNQIFILHAFL